MALNARSLKIGHPEETDFFAVTHATLTLAKHESENVALKLQFIT